MSTYLVAFVVSEFVETKIDGETDELAMSIWTPDSLKGQANYAKTHSRHIITKLEERFGYSYNEMGIHHLDQVAIPDFAAGAMENWGLMTYRDTALLTTGIVKKEQQRVANVIAHEFAHSWFGDLVTTKWWSDTWLNEGFATYFESHGLVGIKAMEEFQLEKQFVLEDMHTVMEIDGNANAGPLSSKETDVETVDQIQGKFGSITYSKGGSIVRMMEKIVGVDKFNKVLQEYLRYVLCFLHFW